MSEKVGEIYYEVDLETAKLIAGSRKAADVLDAMGKNARNASSGIDKLDSSGRKASGTMGVLKAALSGVASAISVALIIDYGKAFLTVADNVTQLQARISRLSADTAEAKATFSTLAMIASNTGASLQDTQNLWEKLTSSLKATGATNSQILFLTDTLQKIGRVGGSSAEEMAGALRQFGQSIDGGIVRAEEFNSIVESMPELARQIAAGMGVSMGQLRQEMLAGKVTSEAALNAIAKQSGVVNQEFNKLPRTLEQANNSLTVSLSLLVDKMNEATGASKTMVGIIDSVSAAIDRLSGRAETAAQKIADLTSTGEMYSKRARTWAWLGLDGWAQQNTTLAALSSKAATLVGDLDAVGKASENAANAGKGFSGGASSNPKQDNLVKVSERRLALAKQEGEARARLQAQYDAADAGVTDQKRIKALQDEYAETYRVTEARKESNKAGKQSETQSESIAQKLANLKQQSELAADSTQELSREQAILTAQLSLGKGATQEQLALAGQYAAKKWDTANAIRAQAAAEKLLPEARENASYTQDVKDLQTALDAKKITQQQYNQTSEQLEAQHQVNLAKIRAQQTVSPMQEARGQIDPVQQLANQHAQELALIQQFESQKGQITLRGLELMNAANTQYEQQRIAAQWEIYRNQSLGNEALAASFDALAGNASNALTGMITGSMSAQEAMQSLSSTVLNSLINSFVQMGVEWAKNAIMGAATQQAAIAATTSAQVAGIGVQTAASTTAAAATTAAWTPAAMMSSIASLGGAVAIGVGAMAGILALSGKRKNGGPVSAGSMYQVGEGGKPEIYQASTGKQYMIPGDNGKVISNKDMQGGGGLNVQVVINNQASSAEPQYVGATQNDGNYVLEFLISDAERNGPYISTLQSTLGLSRKANGAF